jgi:uncharacterized membrane protein YfcA
MTGIESEAILLLIIVFFSTLTRSTFGFGDAVVGMPLLAMTVGLRIATPLMALTALTIALAILAKNWQSVQFKSTWRLIVSSMAGIPIGIFFLKGVNENIVKAVLAVVTISFAVYNLVKPKLFKLTGDNFAFPVGFFAGILGGAYNTNGPPVVFYGTLKRWPPASFRATLQGYFFSTGLFVVVGHALAGNYTAAVLNYYLLAMPVVLTAIFIGGRLNRKIPADHFIRFIYWFLIIIGILLLADSL